MTDYYAEAAGHFLCDYLPDDYKSWDDEELYQFLEDNAWEPFEHWNGRDIDEQISILVDTLEKVAKEARESTDDEKGGNT